ncbi:von Willebrand factor D and EGF domain-containing protein-like [Clytia hemisphaerica]|uniref:von Willebrand factor D and EGF domain-containing protein-like n=1 Tax=Clytia hemisphaerica TaxID=252671 RepID=UPI0034D619E4
MDEERVSFINERPVIVHNHCIALYKERWPSDQRRQRLKPELTDTGYIKTNDIDYHDAYLLSISELVVEIPENDLKISGDIDGSPGKPMGGFSIAMSNDGVKYSTNESIFIVYDSKCLQCNANNIPICVRKNDSCNINGYCFNAGQDYPNNWCKMCDPSTNSFVNKTLKENSPPTFKNKTNHIAITNQVNHYVILAEDPERKNQITYSTVGESNGFAISSTSGLLSYKPTKIGETQVTIRATDICGAFTDKEFTFEALKCPCEGLNGGSCRFNETDRMQLECVCPQGCTGEKCDQPLPGETCKIEKDNEKNKGNAGDVGESTDLALILGPVFGVVFLVPLMIALYLCCRSKKQKRVINDPSNMRMKKMSLIVETVEGTSASGKVTPVEGIDNKSMKKED